MDPVNNQRSVREKVLPLVIFMAIAFWRIFSQPTKSLWRDWLLILAVYGTYTIFARASRALPVVTASVMAFLLGIYIHGQLPYSLSVFGLTK